MIRGGDIRSRAMRLTPKSGWDAQRFWTPSTTRPVEPAALRLPADAVGGSLLLGHTKLKSTVRYLGIEVDDALEMAEQNEV